MTERDLSFASLGEGMRIAQECITAARTATSPEDKILHLTDAVDALFRHLQHIESEQKMAEMNRQLGNF
jgi:hypothetical protein